MLRTSAFALAVASLCLLSAGVSEAGWKKRCNTCDSGCNSCSTCNTGCSSCISCNSGCTSCDSCSSCGTASTVAPNNNTAGGPPAAPQMAQNGQTYRSFSYDSNGNAVSNNGNVIYYQSAPSPMRSSNGWNHSAGDKALGNYGR